MKTISSLEQAYVWLWLPHENHPTVVGKLERLDDGSYDFFYGKSYLKNSSAISLDNEDLFLQENRRFTSPNLHYVFRDALPDSWGQRILFHQYSASNLTPINMLLLSSSDRIGALHFQESPDLYKPQYENHAKLEELIEATEILQQGKLIPDNLAKALLHGTSIGGARPKALIEDNGKKYLAKFSSSSDIFPIVQAEHAAMWLAAKVGIRAASTKLVQSSGKFVVLVERFDREFFESVWTRKFMISALTLLRLKEEEGRYASYLDLSDQIRKYNQNPISDLHELYRRMVFNILVGNTDDHAKNHAFFWDGKFYSLTPAYDICPYLRSGNQATQAMTVGEYGSYSLLKNALSAARYFQLTQTEAQEIIDNLVEDIKKFWPEACDHAMLTQHQRNLFMGTAVLNPFCFYDSP